MRKLRKNFAPKSAIAVRTQCPTKIQPGANLMLLGTSFETPPAELSNGNDCGGNLQVESFESNSRKILASRG
jgi:hypothetical protein